MLQVSGINFVNIMFITVTINIMSVCGQYKKDKIFQRKINFVACGIKFADMCNNF